MRAALDTNILAYAEGVDDPVRRDHAQRLIDRSSPEYLVIPAQVLGELFNVLVRKNRRDPLLSRRAIDFWAAHGEVASTTESTLATAAELAAEHRLSIWDSVILAASAEASCEILLSEDLQDGFRWRGVTVVNPFAEGASPLLEAFLAQP